MDSSELILLFKEYIETNINIVKKKLVNSEVDLGILLSMKKPQKKYGFEEIKRLISKDGLFSIVQLEKKFYLKELQEQKEKTYHLGEMVTKYQEILDTLMEKGIIANYRFLLTTLFEFSLITKLDQNNIALLLLAIIKLSAKVNANNKTTDLNSSEKIISDYFSENLDIIPNLDNTKIASELFYFINENASDKELKYFDGLIKRIEDKVVKTNINFTIRSMSKKENQANVYFLTADMENIKQKIAGLNFVQKRSVLKLLEEISLPSKDVIFVKYNDASYPIRVLSYNGVSIYYLITDNIDFLILGINNLDFEIIGRMISDEADKITEPNEEYLKQQSEFYMTIRNQLSEGKRF